MDICETIKTMRDCGVCTASIVEANNASLEDVVNRFGLDNDCRIYNEIDSTQATKTLENILYKDMAYSCEIMPIRDALKLANDFILTFDLSSTRFFTNGNWGEQDFTESLNGKSTGITIGPRASWSPATEATFDTGVIVISPSKIGCLWIEDED